MKFRNIATGNARVGAQIGAPGENIVKGNAHVGVQAGSCPANDPNCNVCRITASMEARGIKVERSKF